MWPYWLSFAILASPIFAGRSAHRGNEFRGWWFVTIFLVVLIGFRHEVGGDWINYLRHYWRAEYVTFNESVGRIDLGYAIVNWLVAQIGLSIYAVNTFCALVFVSGLTSFARRQPNPWLALLVAFPYLITVVAMGYTRQAVAIGFIFFALNSLTDRRLWSFILFMALATTFHKTALILLPLGVAYFGRGWLLRAIAIFLAGYALYGSFLEPQKDYFIEQYLDTKLQSQGAQIRVLMNLVPGLILLFTFKRWRASFEDSWFWFWIAIGTVAAAFTVSLASTATDRVSLYFIPIQIVVFSRLPEFLHQSYGLKQNAVSMMIVLEYGLVLFVWLNYAVYAPWWVPYQNLIFL